MNARGLVASEEARSGFYPTPPDLSEELLSGINWKMVENVLEPQSGKGNIVRAVMEEYVALCGYGDRRLNVDCVEIDPYLRSILQYEFCGQRMSEMNERLRQLDKKKAYDSQIHDYRQLNSAEAAEYRRLKREQKHLRLLDLHIVHDDFHTFQSRKHYDLIAMNPPFADGDAHLLKAIELQQRSGGMIRCILNAETIRNPFTNRRRILVRKLQELEAEIKYVEGAFSDSERRTDVEVALIIINIPAPKRESVIFDRLRRAAEIDEVTPNDVTEMTVADFMGQIVSRFNVEVDAGIELIREYEAMKSYLMESFEASKYNYPTLTLCIGEPGQLSRGRTPSINKYLRLVRTKYWAALFSNKEFVGKLTSNLREEYMKKVSAMADFDFTLFNIQQIAEQMNAEMDKGIQETIVALFDKLTEEYAWYPECAKNIHYYNGWKTNKVHKINSKVIMPTYGIFSTYSWAAKNTFELHQAEKTISDIEKVFDYLDGNETAIVDLHGVLLRAYEAGQTRNIQCKYFDVTLYKKGTMHIKFRNQALVDRFNIYCCRKKNWLPPSYGRTVYKDMTAEERAVVDGFHGDGSEGAGEASYQVVMAKPAYYLAEPTKEVPMLMAPAT